MGSRGRGGGGRGRGRASLSFNVEQLGLAPGEVLPGPVLQPPPLFPPLEFKPSSLLNNASYESQLQLKSDFLEYFTKSDVYIHLKTQPENEQTLDTEPSKIRTKPFYVDWSYIPPELKQNASRKKKKNDSRDNVPKKVQKKTVENVNVLLEELEKKETIQEKDKDTEGDAKKKDDDEQEMGEGDEFEEEDPDEEMDDGTDYNQNYFDNGEGYLDEEDDNLDDGPIY